MPAKRYIFNWKNNPVRADRYGQCCRVVAQADRNTYQKFWRTVVVQFDDGHTMCTSRFALRAYQKHISEQLTIF